MSYTKKLNSTKKQYLDIVCFGSSHYTKFETGGGTLDRFYFQVLTIKKDSILQVVNSKFSLDIDSLERGQAPIKNIFSIDCYRLTIENNKIDGNILILDFEPKDILKKFSAIENYQKTLKKLEGN